MVLQPGRRSKMEMPYVGPYRVMEGPDERDRYKLADVQGRMFNEFHVSRLKLWPLEGAIEDGYFEVERIVDVRINGQGVKTWRVRWKGYGKKHDTWEAWESFNEAAREEVLAFERERNSSAAPSAGVGDDAAARDAPAGELGSRSADKEVTDQPNDYNDSEKKKNNPKESVPTAGPFSDTPANAPREAAPSHTELRAQRLAKRAADREARAEI